MAKKSNDSGVEVKAVNADELDAGEQDRLLLDYRATGVNRGYVDPSRDQEADIAPEFGVAPHPEMFNPAPPSEARGAVALNPEDHPMVLSAEEKEKRGAEIREAQLEQAQADLDAQAEAAEQDEAVEPPQESAEERLSRLQVDESVQSRG